MPMPRSYVPDPENWFYFQLQTDGPSGSWEILDFYFETEDDFIEELEKAFDWPRCTVIAHRKPLRKGLMRFEHPGAMALRRELDLVQRRQEHDYWGHNDL